MLFIGYKPIGQGVEFVPVYVVEKREHLTYFLNSLYLFGYELNDIKNWYVLDIQFGPKWILRVSEPDKRLIRLRDWVRDNYNEVFNKEVCEFFEYL